MVVIGVRNDNADDAKPFLVTASRVLSPVEFNLDFHVDVLAGEFVYDVEDYLAFQGKARTADT